MINMFSQMACICHFVFFYVLLRASYGYNQCVFIPSVVWGFSNYYFQLFRCRNLDLNSFFPTFPYRQACFILRGHPYAPMFVCSPIHSYTLPYICIPPDTPICSQCPNISVYSMGYLHVLWAKHFLFWGSGGVSISASLLVSVCM